jgi:hypothetical protein
LEPPASRLPTASPAPRELPPWGSILALAFAASSALAQPAPGPKVDAPGKLPEPPPSIPDLAYDARLLSSAASAESFQGPLDGGWTLGAQGAGDLYALQLTDRRDHVEGAWRDLRRPGDPAASGFLDQIQRSSSGLSLRFTPQGQAPITVALGPNLRGQAEQDGRRFPVALRRGVP